MEASTPKTEGKLHHARFVNDNFDFDVGVANIIFDMHTQRFPSKLYKGQ